MEKTGAVLGPILKSLGLESGVRLAALRRDWHSIFDPQICSHLFPASLSEKELLLHVSSPIWMQQFVFRKEEIVKRLERYGVKKVRFRLGTIPNRLGETTPVIIRPEIRPEDSLFVEELVSGIEDSILKEAIIKAAERSFTAKKTSRL